MSKEDEEQITSTDVAIILGALILLTPYGWVGMMLLAKILGFNCN